MTISPIVQTSRTHLTLRQSKWLEIKGLASKMGYLPLRAFL